MVESDHEICVLLQEGKEKGIDLLFNKYYRGLVLWADTFLNDMAKSEDVVQEFFVKLWEKHLTTELHPDTLKSYLFTSVKHIALNSLEKVDPLKRAYDVNRIDRPWIEYNDLTEEMLCQVEKEIEKLSPRSRDVIKAIYVEGLHYREVAEKYDISIATVKTLLVNALKRLRANSTHTDTSFLLLFIKKVISRFNRF
jgi:RNA polymerase sigma factor, sigma-70 family